MANQFITPQIVANEALALLKSQMVYKDLVYTDYSSEFVPGVGATVNVRVPASFSANDFSTSISTQDATETYVPVVLNRFKDVSVKMTSKDWTLNIKDFSKQIVAPATLALAEVVDQDIANRIFGDAYYTETRTAITPTNLANIAALGKDLDKAKAPKVDRSLVFGPDHKYVYALTDNLSKASYAGDNQALRDANLGRLYSFETYMDQNTPTSTAATSGTQYGSVKVASSSDANEVDFTVGQLATGTLVIGDGFVYDGILYRVTENVTFVSNAKASVAVSPSFPAGVTATTVYIVRNGTSVAFQRDAVTFVNRPLAVPEGAVKAAIASAEGLSVRVVFGYDMTTKTDTISFDILYGVKTLRSTHLARLIDGALS